MPLMWLCRPCHATQLGNKGMGLLYANATTSTPFNLGPNQNAIATNLVGRSRDAVAFNAGDSFFAQLRRGQYWQVQCAMPLQQCYLGCWC